MNAIFLMSRNRIQVSNTKKILLFYVIFAKVFFFFFLYWVSFSFSFPLWVFTVHFRLVAEETPGKDIDFLLVLCTKLGGLIYGSFILIDED